MINRSWSRVCIDASVEKCFDIVRNSWLDAQLRSRLISRSLDSVSLDEPFRWNRFVADTTYRWVMFVSSQLNLLIYEINAFAWIEFWIFEFHHEWCALKSSQIIAFSKMSKEINFRSIVYSWFSPWFFSFYTLKIMKFSILDEISSIWIFESFNISYFEVVLGWPYEMKWNGFFFHFRRLIDWLIDWLNHTSTRPRVGACGMLATVILNYHLFLG